MLPKIMWAISRYQHTIHQMLGYPTDGPVKVLETLLSVFLILTPLLAVGTIIWILYKRLMIRLGKDALTNYRHYQKTFTDNCTYSPDGIANNISEYPSYLADRDKRNYYRMMIFLTIVGIIALSICIIFITFDILDLIYTIYYQLREHHYTDHAFLGFVFQNIWKIVSPIVIPITIFFIIIFFGKITKALYTKTHLLLKTRTRITTKIIRIKKVRYEKSDV